MAGHKVLFIVETGWRGMREASLESLKKGFLVDIFIKGVVEKQILDIITKPSDKYRICAIPRWFFRVSLFFYLLWHRICRNFDKVIVSKERTRDWVKGFGVETKVLVETKSGYELK